MIKVAHLRKNFGKVEAVSDVSFEAHDGQITGILGENGAGKTTTIRVLAGILRASSGSIAVDGHEVRFGHVRTQYSLGVLSDARGLSEKLTAEENIILFGELCGVDRKTLNQRLAWICEILEMDDIIHRRTEGFSTGQKVKTALGRVLVSDPQNLILDEPTSGLDVMSTRNFRTILKRLKDQGKCIIFTTHIMREVELLCDAIMVMHKGMTLAEGSIEGIIQETQSNDLEEAFVKYIDGDGIAGDEATINATRAKMVTGSGDA